MRKQYSTRQRISSGGTFSEALEARRMLAAIASGQTITDTLTPGGTLQYTFAASAGQTFRVHAGVAAATGSALLPRLTLFKANNLQASTAATVTANSSVSLLYTVPTGEGGTFTARVEGANNSAGAFAIELAKSQPTQAADSDGDGGTIARGQTRFGTFNRPGDIDIFQVNLAAGDRFRLTTSPDVDASFALPAVVAYGADGTNMQNGSIGSRPGRTASAGVAAADVGGVNTSIDTAGTVTATQAGVITVLIFSGTPTNTGTYALEFYSRPAPGVALPPPVADYDGDSGPLIDNYYRVGSIDRPGDQDVYTLTGVAGDALRLYYSAPYLQSLNIALLSPLGQSLGTWDYANNSISVANLPTTGTYTAVVYSNRELTNSAFSFNYSLQVSFTASTTRSPSWAAVDSGSSSTYDPVTQTLTINAGVVSIIKDPRDIDSNAKIIANGSSKVVFYNSAKVNSLTLNNTATAEVASHGGVLHAVRMTIGSTARLDLGDNDLVVDTLTTVAAVTGRIAAARNGGTWTGYGITSTTARDDAAGGHTLGVMSGADYFAINGAAATFDGEEINASSVLVRYTRYGDADFTRTVDFNDFLRVQSGFGQPSSTFSRGDFDLDGDTDFNDFLLLQGNFGQTA